MQITRSGEYGLKGLVYLAQQPADKRFLVSEVSRAQKIPGTYLAKIFQRLSKAGLLRSVRGLKGGFVLGKPPKEITMREVLEALDGPIAINRCLLRPGECEEESVCTLHHVLEEAQLQFIHILDKTTIEDLAKKTVQSERDGRR